MEDWGVNYLMLSLINPVPLPPLAVVLAFVIDRIAGDPEWMPHPVRWIGRFVNIFEAVARRFAGTPQKKRLGGALIAVVTTGAVWGLAVIMLSAAHRYSTPLFFSLSTYIVYACLAAKALETGALSVLDAPDIEEARQRLSRIVGRDTGSLTRAGVYRAVIETVAENASDGAVAPLFFLAVGGPPLMLAYKAVNTMDSMLGYKNGRYIDLGWFPARLDDVANWLPARLTALLLAASAFFLGYNWRKSLKTFLEDGGSHPSPNSGRPEAAAAGALGCRLGGPSIYGGISSDKPFIGRGLGEPDEAAARGAVRLLFLTAALMVLVTAAARAAAIFIL